MRELLQFLARLVEQMDHLADGTGEQSLALVAWMTGDVLHPFHAEVGDIADRGIAVDAAECPVIAAGDEARRAGVGRERKRRTVMHLDLPPVPLVGDRDQMQRSVAQCERRRPAGAIEAHRDNECIQVAVDSAGAEQELGDGVAHDAAPPPPTLPRFAGEGDQRSLGGGGRARGHPPNQPHSPRTPGAGADD